MLQYDDRAARPAAEQEVVAARGLGGRLRGRSALSTPSQPTPTISVTITRRATAITPMAGA
jgi:hypothetical protein